MKRLIAFLFMLICILVIEGCSGNMEKNHSMEESHSIEENRSMEEITNNSINSLTLGELSETEDREQIGNQIPEWVSEVDWNKSLYVISSSDIERFDTYAQENFPSYCDAGWTQEQSDAVCLGHGIEMFVLDGGEQINRIIYYPVILNGVIVGGYEVYEILDNQNIFMQASPFLANELNLMMDLTSKDTPLILGYNNDNTIGVIGDTYYVLDIDHLKNKHVEADKIPAIEINTCVNAMEILCTERTANVDDWVIAPGYMK